MKKWIKVKDKLPAHGDGSFLTCWENQNNLMLLCFVDIHGNYIIAGSSGDSCGFNEHPKFSHWMPVPKPPEKETDKAMLKSGYCIDCNQYVLLDYYNAKCDPPLMVCGECGQFVYNVDDPKCVVKKALHEALKNLFL